MWVLSVNGPPIGWHDSSACLVNNDGLVVAFAEEERFSRTKHALEQPPRASSQFCLEQAGISQHEIDVVAIGWDVPHMYSQYNRTWVASDRKAVIEHLLGWSFGNGRWPDVVFVPHHTAHALCAFYASPFPSASVLIVDGNGEHESISIYSMHTGKYPVRKLWWPRSHSLGLLYDAASRALGFDSLEAGKTMGLASYGKHAELEPWPLFTVTDGDFTPAIRLTEREGTRDVTAAWQAYLLSLARTPLHSGRSDELDTDLVAIRIAWSAQAAVERVLTMLASEARTVVDAGPLCLAGGVALNCQANGLLPAPVYVPPVPHDAGVALGAAWYVSPPGGPRHSLTPFLGSNITADEVASALRHWEGPIRPLNLDDVVERLVRGEIGAVVEGRAEAVGARET
jgi:carbamoyltransferase